MRVSLGWGVLLDYSGMDVRGKTFAACGHTLYGSEEDAKRMSKWHSVWQSVPTRIVEVFCEVPDGAP